METRRSVKAIVTWYKDPSRFQVNECLRDIIVNVGELRDGVFYGDSWTVLVRITDFVDGTWDTYSDVAFIVDEAPWHLLEKGYSFKLWHGRDIAKLTIL